MQIAALALGIGNVRSVVRALERASDGRARIVTTADPDVIRRADAVVAPGQGSFGAFARAIAGAGVGEAVVESIRAGKPYLGICLGLQVLFEASAESEGDPGLAVLGGRVERLVPGIEPGTSHPWPLPHIGWNRVEPVKGTLVTADHYYFAHTFAAVPADPAVTLARATYGDQTFVAAIEHENVVGIQFHPEKSQRRGLAVLGRFFERILR